MWSVVLKFGVVSTIYVIIEKYKRFVVAKYLYSLNTAFGFMAITNEPLEVGM
jgi:hypothetical protein